MLNQLLDIKQISEIEAEADSGLWILSTHEALNDLDNDELLSVVQNNLKRGLTYKAIVPENETVSPFSGCENGFRGSYEIRTIPRQIFDLSCEFQIHDPFKRNRRGFFSIRVGAEYFWIEMDRDILRDKIDAFEYWWKIPKEIRSVIKAPHITENYEGFEKFDELASNIIKNQKLLAILKRDYCNTLEAFEFKLWKLSYVCCMGIVETLIDQCLKDNNIDIQKKGQIIGFAQKVKLAKENNLVKRNTGNMVDSLRDIRNVVHPSYEVRNNLEIKKENVEIALSFLFLLLREWA